MILSVPYVRTSTDDKCQDPERQLEVIQPWATREGVALLEAVIDEGTSASKTDPFERPRFVEACERARTAGASAIVVECSDRFSRQGAKLDAWAEVELERRYGLRLLRADKSLEQHGSMTAAVTDTIHAESARAWVQAHVSKVRSGMAKARKNGAQFGRPRKSLTGTELALAMRLRTEGLGWRRVAREINRARGALELTDAKRRRAVSVTHTLVQRFVETVAKVEA
jgi:DNA invertase Pin-like site-specific DNA recombinase